MIRHEPLAEPRPVFVRSFSHSTCFGHGQIVARRLFERPSAPGVGEVIYYDVQMADGRLKTVTPDMVCDPANVSARVIMPAPLRIPAPPAKRGEWL